MNGFNMNTDSCRIAKSKVRKLAGVHGNYRATNSNLVSTMDTKNNNQFSANLFSLQLQLKTLLEDAGGDHALALLDALCKLNRSEQEIVIRMLTKIVQKLIQSDVRFSCEEDRVLNEFEDALYQDIVGEMQRASTLESAQNLPFQRRPVTGTEARLAILKGGRNLSSSTEMGPTTVDPTAVDPGLIDFSQALQKRRDRATTRPTLN